MRYLALITLLATRLLAQGTFEVQPDVNDTLVNGVPAVSTPCPPGTQAFGSIDGITDFIDWFSFQLTSAQDVRIWTGPGYTSPIGDTVLVLRDARDLILEVDDGAIATHGFYSKMTLSALAPGSYYVGVRGFSALVAGSYTLDVVAAPVGTLVPLSSPLRPVFSGLEPNDPTIAGGMATASTLATRNEGLLTQGGGGTSLVPGLADYDWFSFPVTSTTVVTLSTRAPGGATPLQPAVTNTVLHLLDSNFSRIAFNDDDAGTGYSRLRRELTPGLYYAVVNGFGANDTGYYWLDIQGSPASQGPVASVTEQPVSPLCRGAGPLPHLGVRGVRVGTVVVRPEQPVAGSTFCLDIENVYWPVYGVVGFVGGGAPTDLGVFSPSFVGCSTDINLNASFDWLPQQTGMPTVHFWMSSVPLATSLLGLSYDVQAGGADAQGRLALTNRCSIAIGLTH